MVGLNSNGGSERFGYYIIVREVGGGKKTDVSAQNQIDKVYFNQLRSEFSGAGEVEEDEVYIEGSVKSVIVNQYERNKQARAACIAHFGSSCQACGFDFEHHYGALGKGFIEGHHIIPLSQIKKDYEVDPKKDLVPVCSNCHSIIRIGKEPLSVSEVKFIVSQQRTSKKQLKLAWLEPPSLQASST